LLGGGIGGAVGCSMGLAAGDPRGMLTGPVCVEGSFMGTVIPDGRMIAVVLSMVTYTKWTPLVRLEGMEN